mgnify:CR=1 FL=1
MNDDYGVLIAPDTVRIERLLPGSIDRVWGWITEEDLAKQQAEAETEEADMADEEADAAVQE